MLIGQNFQRYFDGYSISIDLVSTQKPEEPPFCLLHEQKTGFSEKPVFCALLNGFSIIPLLLGFVDRLNMIAIRRWL